MLPNAITVLMKDDVTIKKKVNEDGYGNITTTSISSKAYVDYRKRMISRTDGDMIASDVQVYPEVDVPDLEEGSVLLPDGTELPIKSVRRPAWPDGTRHTEVFL